MENSEQKSGALIALNMENNGSLSYYDKDFSFYVSKDKNFVWLQIGANIFSVGNARDVRGLSYDEEAGALFEIDEKGVRKDGGFCFPVPSQEIASRIAALFIRYVAFCELDESNKKETPNVDLSKKEVVQTAYNEKEEAYVAEGKERAQARRQEQKGSKADAVVKKPRPSSGMFVPFVVGVASAIFISGALTYFLNQDAFSRNEVNSAASAERSGAAQSLPQARRGNAQENALEQKAVNSGSSEPAPSQSASNWVPPAAQ